MRKIKLLIVGLFLSLFITGCLSEVDTVKSGVMNFNKTITVGEAFDNWNNCKKGEWETFETDNKIKVVQFTCLRKDIKEYMSKVKSFLSEKEQAKASCLDVVSSTQTFQFTINKDDTFQIDNVQVETVWSDGKKYSDSQETMKELERVYENEITFNINDLNKMAAGQIAYVFQIIKLQAK